MSKFAFLLVIRKSEMSGEVFGQRFSVNLYDTYESACVGCFKATSALHASGWTVMITTMLNVTENQTTDVTDGIDK